MTTPDLTDRQTEALRLVGEGFTIDEIAASMGCSSRTAKYYVDRLREKFGVKNKLQLVRVAREREGQA